MTKQEYRTIGYIRSNCLSKIAPLVDHLPKTQFNVFRSFMERRMQEAKYSWCKCMIHATKVMDMNWSAWRDQEEFAIVLKELTAMKMKHHFEDFTVEKIEVGIDDKELVRMINKHLPENMEKFEDDTRFFVLFRNKPISTDTMNGWDVKAITKINLNAYVNLKFKKGVMDLTGIKTGIGTTQDLTFLANEKEVIKQILSHLKVDVWFSLPEVMEILEPKTNHNPYPGAIRTYERKEKSTWSFIADEEVIAR